MKRSRQPLHTLQAELAASASTAKRPRRNATVHRRNAKLHSISAQPSAQSTPTFTLLFFIGQLADPPFVFDYTDSLSAENKRWLVHGDIEWNGYLAEKGLTAGSSSNARSEPLSHEGRRGEGEVAVGDRVFLVAPDGVVYEQLLFDIE